MTLVERIKTHSYLLTGAYNPNDERKLRNSIEVMDDNWQNNTTHTC